MVYLDNAATTRTSPTAMGAMAHVMAGDAFANPSSQHAAGDAALRALEEARREVAACLRSRPSEVEWVSCGTEAKPIAFMNRRTLPRCPAMLKESRTPRRDTA